MVTEAAVPMMTAWIDCIALPRKTIDKVCKRLYTLVVQRVDKKFTLVVQMHRHTADAHEKRGHR
ncbi:hypothetical protein A9Q02_07900 [Candidatus Chloroploca asiatica]|uniref:Uncharacterized protein n=1 Tax=Candidatus Chloroploca asiatica TaxID=1506545 RepID=A0A2H3KR99_9CHLR|nr:hypothetical protein A9Q02_07900 [Candidatus Chloroploca asiatica]